MDITEAKKAARIVQGNTARIKRLMRRAEVGGAFHIGFLGGSITQGSVASSPELCYASLVWKWWSEKFPKSRFSYINAGIGGTTSLFGAARTWMDLMRYRPDFVIVDFTVNDEAEPFFQETYEGVLRQIYGDEAAPAVMLLHNVYYDDGRNAQEYHRAVAEHYEIPAVSMKDSMYRLIQDGAYCESDLTPDHLHPNDAGHRLLADILIWQLEEIYAQLFAEDGSGAASACGNDDAASAGGKTDAAASVRRKTGGAGTLIAKAGRPAEKEAVCPAPLTANRFEHAKRWQITNCRPRLSGFRVDPREKTAMLDLYKNGWTGIRKGDAITFTLDASCIAVQFRRSVWRKSPVAEATLDGDRAHTVVLDGNFDEDWGDCLYLQRVLDDRKRAEHTLEIHITESGEAVEDEFYLVSVITD